MQWHVGRHSTETAQVQGAAGSVPGPLPQQLARQATDNLALFPKDVAVVADDHSGVPDGAAVLLIPLQDGADDHLQRWWMLACECNLVARQRYKNLRME